MWIGSEWKTDPFINAWLDQQKIDQNRTALATSMKVEALEADLFEERVDN